MPCLPFYCDYAVLVGQRIGLCGNATQARIGQQFQIHSPIVVDEEHILAIVAPLRDVMGTTDRNCPR